jgi:hypothetical protein
MKVHLLFADRSPDPEAPQPPHADDLVRDLGLDVILRAMTAGDRYLAAVVPQVVLSGLTDEAAIRYRQRVLADCLAQPAVIRELYAITVEAITAERKVWGYTKTIPDSLLNRSVTVMRLFLVHLRRLRTLAAGHLADVDSDGFRRLFAEISEELDEPYLEEVAGQLDRLRFRDGVVLTAGLGPGNKGVGHVLRRRVDPPSWRERIGLRETDSHVYQLAERDDSGVRALGDIKGRGVALAAEALARSVDHILSYLEQLRMELAFYVGCINLHEHLARRGAAVAMPDPAASGDRSLAARGSYDVALTLMSPGSVVANDLDADGSLLLVVTGANRGGKSTFLRSVGQAQVMMQCGMFVGARVFRADIRDRVLTHFRHEEEATLESGKLDEELGRMSAIVDVSTPASLVLLNESFASTNEREGSEIGRQLLRAMVEAGIRVVFVTHLHDLAASLVGAGVGDPLRQ